MTPHAIMPCARAWHRQVRPEVDAVYATLVGLMFGALERVAASDAKHGDRLRGENYAYFVEVCVGLWGGGGCWRWWWRGVRGREGEGPNKGGEEAGIRCGCG